MPPEPALPCASSTRPARSSRRSRTTRCGPGGAFDITARLAGAVAAYFIVAVVLLSASVVLGLVVLIGVPLLALTLATVIRPLQARQREQREEVGKLTALGADTAAGLRVLRGIGGEPAFLDRYRKRSQHVRNAGVRVAAPQSTLDAAQVLLPGIFVVLVTWIGARFALSGEIGVGELVAFYGYAAFLVIPLRTAAEAVDKITRGVRGRAPHARRARRRAERPGARRTGGRAAGRRAARRSALGARGGTGLAHVHRLAHPRRGLGDRRPAWVLRSRVARRSAVFRSTRCRLLRFAAGSS